MDDSDLTPSERVALERVDALLADPALWTEPPAGLEDRVVAAIAEESGAGQGRRLTRYAVAALAASVLVAVGVGVAASRDHHPVVYAATVAPTGLVPGVSGDVHLTRTTSGWKIRLQVSGLPRRDHGLCYEAWMKSDQGTLVSVGTFNQGDDVTLWSGVSPDDFGTLTVTREFLDGNPASSGEVVLTAHPERP